MRHFADQPGVPPIKQTHQHCSVKYTRYSTDDDKLVAATQAVEAWTCPLGWDVAMLFEKYSDADDAAGHEDDNVSRASGSHGDEPTFHEHCLHTYQTLAAHCPDFPNTRRLRSLMETAAHSGGFSHLQKRDTFASRCELPVDGFKPLTVASVTINDAEDNPIVHAIGTVHREVRATSLWDNPRLVYALHQKIKKFLNQEGAECTCNLMNIMVKILAPHPDNSAILEAHVLEVMPFAGPNTCTVNAIYINHDAAASMPKGDPKGFLNLPPTYRDDGSDPAGEIMGHGLTAHLCPGSHRNCRLGLHDLVKLFSEKSILNGGWLDEGETASLPDDAASSLVWYTRHQEHDFLISTYKLQPDTADSQHADHSNTHSVILAVHYPPYITHWPPMNHTARQSSSGRPRPPPFNHAHYPPLPAGHGPARSAPPPRERARLVKPDAPLNVPFYAQLIAGRRDANDLLEERYAMDYRALAGADLFSFQQARALVAEFAAETSRTISATFGGEGWHSDQTIYQNILHQGWNSATHQPQDPHIESAREMWFNAWDELINNCIMRELTQGHGPAMTRISLDHLLDVGAFRPRGEFSESEQLDLWRRVTGDADTARQYMQWLQAHPTVPLNPPSARSGHAAQAASRTHPHRSAAPARGPGPAHGAGRGPAQTHTKTYKRGQTTQKGPSKYADYVPKHYAGEDGYMPSDPPDFNHDSFPALVPDASEPGPAYEPAQPVVEPAPAPAPQDRRMIRIYDPKTQRWKYATQATKLSRKVVLLPPRAPPLAAKLEQLEQRLARSEQSANMEHLLTRLLSHLDLA